MSGHRPTLASLLLLLALLVSPAAADSVPPLTAVVRTQTPRPRSNAPIPLEIDLTFTSGDPGKLLEGKLTVSASSAGQLMCQWVSPTLTLPPGTQTVRLLLPPVAVPVSPVDLNLSFEGKSGVIALDPTEIAVSKPQVRQMVIAISDPWAGSTSRHSLNADLLQLNRVELDSEQKSVTTVSTLPFRLTPEEMPINPLAYTAYDMLYLEGEGFARLSEEQLQAIEQWLAAGGSVCVIPNTPAGPDQAAMLNHMADLAENPLRFSLNEAGGMTWLSDSPDSLVMLRPGLGRLVVARNPPSRPGRSVPAWRTAGGFLWKFNGQSSFKPIYPQAESDDPPTPPTPQPAAGPPQPQVDPRALRYASGNPYAYPPNQPVRGGVAMAGGSTLALALAPPLVRPVPLSVVALLLVLFALAIGPGDYFLLGAIRRRRWTWALMPLLAVGATYIMARTSSYYLGRSDLKRSLTIIDLGPGGRPLRASRFESSFTAADRSIQETRHDQLWATLPVRQDNLSFDQRAFQAVNAAIWDDASPALVEGRYPGQFTSTMRTRQWTSQMTRTTTFNPQDVPPPLDWQAADPTLRENIQPSNIFLHLTAGKPLPPNSAVWLMHLNKVELIGGKAPEWSVAGQYEDFEEIELEMRARRGEADPPVMQFIHGVSAHQHEGFFETVSQVSPQGGDFFEDLPLLDRDDHDQYLLAMLVPDGQDFKLYRRLYIAQHP